MIWQESYLKEVNLEDRIHVNGASMHDENIAAASSTSAGVLVDENDILTESLASSSESPIAVNGASVGDVGKTLNLRVENIDSETLLLMLDAKGVCISAGSACHSHKSEPSRVLTAMGLSDKISYSHKTTV